MIDKTLIVLDIETVKDTDLLTEDWPEDKWPPPIGWKVVAAGILIAHLDNTSGSMSIKIQDAQCVQGEEADLLNRFWSYFNKAIPRLVTWNGRTFDLPVLQHRAFKHAIEMPSYFQSGDKWSNYQHRYSEDWHCDLMDVMSTYGASTRTQMDLMATSMGLPGKIGGHGSEVQAMFDEGEIDRICNYCECDVLNLYGLYIRWCHVTGKMSKADHDAAFENFKGYLEDHKESKEHYVEFLDKWDYSSKGL